MLIAPEGRFIPVNMDRCQDLMGGLFEHVTPVIFDSVEVVHVVLGPLLALRGVTPIVERPMTNASNFVN